MKKLLLLPLIACGDMMTELPLDKEFYEWYCVQQTELDPIDKVHISTNTCDNSVSWIIAEMHLYDGEFFVRRLEKDTLSVNCEWNTYLPLIDDYTCDDVEGVAMSVWVK